MKIRAMQQQPSWLDRFEELRSLSEDDRATLLTQTQVADVPQGTLVFVPGQSADNLLLLLDGSVRVRQRSETGRDIILYRVQAGESCVLTTACMLGFERYSAEGEAETEVRAAMIPRATFDDLVGRSPPFRGFVFATFSRRIADLFALIDDIALRRIDARLATVLLALARDDTVSATHQALASELGTAREVVSRTLAGFQKHGWVSQSRGRVRLVARDAIERLASSAVGD